jgi:hypothetical protein
MAATFANPLVQESGPPRPRPRSRATRKSDVAGAVLRPWLRAQSLNVTRHAAALRPFTREEFGTGAAIPSEGHIQAVNFLIIKLRQGLLQMSRSVTKAIENVSEDLNSAHLQRVVGEKDRAHRWVRGIEKIWDFYFELFGQRQSKYADWLLSCDRIALDCYKVAYTGIGVAKPVPAPPPFSFMRTGFAPATMRRGIPLRRLGKQLNPFPLIQLPYHRLVNPWTLAAVLHEVSHNLQTELGLSRDVPRNIASRLLKADLGKSVASVWTRWNREMFSDMAALLLGGPGSVGSLMDVVGRAPKAVFAYNDTGPHPTPYLRTLISCELLRRMGFPREAEQHARAWTRIYPNPHAGSIPRDVVNTFPKACALAVDAMCYRPYRTLGNKCLAEVMPFAPKDQKMIEEAAKRLAAGVDPGIVPERYLIGASRAALDQKLARPGVIMKNFYQELSRR